MHIAVPEYDYLMAKIFGFDIQCLLLYDQLFADWFVFSLFSNFGRFKFIASLISISTGPDDEDDDEPLLSGSGQVEQECTEEVLNGWAEVLVKWKDHQTRPKQLMQLVRKVRNYLMEMKINFVLL